jgi:ferredoxin-NADP reductase
MTSLLPARKTARSRFSPLNVLESLATPHGLDRYLELVNPMLTVRDLRAEVTNVHRPTADSVTIELRPTRQWLGFTAGQFVQIGVVIDGVTQTRCYSPTCSQYRADGRFELTIKAQAGGTVSQYLFANAKPGLVVNLAQASGTFVLPEQRPERVVLISGGSGITPVLSMLRTLADEGYAGEVTFLHYAYTELDVPHRAELDAIAAAHDNVRVAYAYTEQETGGDLHGYFGVEHLDAVAPNYADAQTFLCGPGPLMRAVRELYLDLGLVDALHTEEFAPAPLAVVDGEVSGEVGFGRSGVTATNSGQTLLEQAEAAGLKPAYGCRMGICFTCTSVKTSGCTRNVLTGDLNSDPDTEVQLCISAPVGDVVIDI